MREACCSQPGCGVRTNHRYVPQLPTQDVDGAGIPRIGVSRIETQHFHSAAVLFVVVARQRDAVPLKRPAAQSAEDGRRCVPFGDCSHPQCGRPSCCLTQRSRERSAELPAVLRSSGASAQPPIFEIREPPPRARILVPRRLMREARCPRMGRDARGELLTPRSSQETS